ncbi:Gfo/Idh/MocA family oxidoreductase [Gracilibacillus caseinilyticus]|uniref:Gfo/Idh/MocA family oxidoreductase n=1 Tax=Gracilibacillus caseinilyticus TaxID=2932256 RepID=A0ABY4ET94_9BACI|nr:Gfo/Idh/MocA family oxidoreductase [Gracilibacillus caseinilyticus]UOQ47646.1 Gfo/Idh/MocA family oxidoreductase [Gracilibacillus caseinilyticus]
MKFSIIGCQHPHISIFIKEMLDLGYKCVGIYESENRTLVKTIAEKYNLKMVDDIDLLLDESVEVVGCASINKDKINIIEMCEQYKKHIMIDKPAVTNRKDFERLKAVAERGKMQIGMLLTERFRPSIYTVKKQIDDGRLGDIVSISMRKPHQLNPAKRPPWHFSKEQSGGIIIDLFVHDIDLLRWLSGDEINTISCHAAKNILPEYPSFYDAAGMQIVMNDGVISQLYADWHTPDKSWTWGDCRLYVVGTKGVAEIRLEGDPFISDTDLVLRVSDDEVLTKVPTIQPPVTITEDFLQRIRGEYGFIGHQDLLVATEATIKADEQANKVNRT